MSGKIDIIMFATPNLDTYTKYSIALWQNYAQRNNCSFYHYSEPYFDDLHIAWSKIKSVEEHLNNHDAEYVLLVDADTVPTNPDYHLKNVITDYFSGRKEKIIFQKDGSDWFRYLYMTHNFSLTFRSKKWTLPNAGFILMKNDNEVRSFYQEWMERAATSPWADSPPRNQSVLVYELLNQEKWNHIVGYFSTNVVNKFKGELCIHFSSKNPEEVAECMLPYYNTMFE